MNLKPHIRKYPLKNYPEIFVYGYFLTRQSRRPVIMAKSVTQIQYALGQQARKRNAK